MPRSFIRAMADSSAGWPTRAETPCGRHVEAGAVAEARPEQRLRHGAPADVAHADDEDPVDHTEGPLYAGAGEGVKNCVWISGG